MLLSLVPLFAYDMYDEKLKKYVINIYNHEPGIRLLSILIIICKLYMIEN